MGKILKSKSRIEVGMESYCLLGAEFPLGKIKKKKIWK